jgi:hypothetical protein
MKYIKKYLKYSQKNKKYNKLFGGKNNIFDLEDFEITTEWNNTEYLNINDKTHVNTFLYLFKDYALKNYGVF